MDIDYRHINSNKLPQEILAIENNLQNFNGSLRCILEDELQNGNLILDVNVDFPEKGSLQVLMLKPFYKAYSFAAVEKNVHGSPHNRGVEYSSTKSLNSIICPFRQDELS